MDSRLHDRSVSARNLARSGRGRPDRRELAQFRPAVDRVQFRIRRANQVTFVADPPPRTWWEGCTRGCFEQLRAELRRNDGGPPIASALFWNMEPLTEAWGAHTMGLTQIEVVDGQRHEGLATFLLNESLSELESQGFQRVQGQVMQGDTTAAHMLDKLGFTQFDTATVLRKPTVRSPAFRRPGTEPTSPNPHTTPPASTDAPLGGHHDRCSHPA